MNVRHLILAIALLGAVGLVMFGDRKVDSSVVEALPRNTTLVTAVQKNGKDSNMRNKSEPSVLMLLDRTYLIGDAESGETPRIFIGNQNWTPLVPPPPARPQNIVIAPAVAPAIPYIYLGKKWEDASWEVYLGKGEHTYIVRTGDTMDGMYQVDAITPPTLQITYLPLKQKQTLSIGGAN